MSVKAELKYVGEIDTRLDNAGLDKLEVLPNWTS